MEVVPLGSADEIAALAADVFEAVVRGKPAAVLGLATGSTPLPAYQELIRRFAAGVGPSYAAVTCFNLDEYVGLPAGHEQSYRATIARDRSMPWTPTPRRASGSAMRPVPMASSRARPSPASPARTSTDASTTPGSNISVHDSS